MQTKKKKVAVKNKGGRPKEPVSKKVDYEQLFQLCEKGMKDTELAKFYKVTERTITRWKKDDEFLSVLKAGKEAYDTMVEKALCSRALGYSHKDVDIKMYEGKIIKTEFTRHFPPDPTSMIFWLKNRQPQKWRDKQELSGDINLNHAIRKVIVPAENPIEDEIKKLEP